MSRVSNALNMYLLLQVRGIMQAKELAKELEVSTRMIKEYKKDLEIAGIHVNSKMGRQGGYYLDHKKSLSGISLTDDEITSLKMAKETINSGNYHYALKFEQLIGKILNNQDQEFDEISYHNKAMRKTEQIIEKEKRIWVEINLAINKKRKLYITYKSIKEKGMETKERTVHPYGIFDYKGATYFYGYCENAKDIRFFKLSRILDYNTLSENYKIKLDFNFDEVLEKSFGIFNDEPVKIKLKIYYPMSEFIKEKQMCKNQKITEINEKTIIFEAKMKGYTEIKSWVLSMGRCVEVVKPIKLKRDIIKEINRMNEIYL